MPTCGEILEYLEGYMPLSLAEDFDNVGLLVGRHSKPVKKALLCLNANLFTAKEAVKAGADLIISHHPLTFSGEKKITEDTVMGETYLTLMENGISVISMHTNFDCAAGGLNDLMAKRLHLTVVEDLDKKENAHGCGRICTAEDMTIKDIIDRIKEAYGVSVVKYTGDVIKPAQKIALCTGSGKSFIPEVIKSGADVYITGDVSYSQALELESAGVSLIDLGHYESEIVCREAFLEMLSGFTDVEWVISKEKNVFSYR